MDLLISLLPVILFLLFLVYMDSFKLVKKTDIFTSFFWGVFSASAAYYINSSIIKGTDINLNIYSRFIAPVIEELIKAVFIVLMIRKNKVGFIIDGTILGFSVGTGFAFMENLYYLNTLETDNPAIWIVRGFGTAIMHGGTTGMLAMIAMRSSEADKHNPMQLFKGILSAVILHGLYNQFWLSPVPSALLVFFTLPVILTMVFRHSESSLRNWLELEFDSEVRILRMIKSGTFTGSKSGNYLSSLKDRFSPEIIVDMLCYIRTYIELSLRAKSNLLLKEAGFPLNRDTELKEKLAELEYLKKNIGKTGLLAISPVLRMNRNDLWKLGQL